MARSFRRTALAALCLLAIISFLTFSNSHPTSSYSRLSYPSQLVNHTRSRIALAQHLSLNTKAFERRKQIALNKEEELAALMQFVTNMHSNSLPLTVDPSKPIDPQLVCDFDTRSQRASYEVQQMTEDVWNQHPVILFKELRSPVGREVKNMIEDLDLQPPLTIIDVDLRSDAQILTPLLKRMTSAPSLPILLIGGQLAAPTISEIRKLRDSGELQLRIAKAGAIIDGGNRKKMKGKRRK